MAQPMGIRRAQCHCGGLVFEEALANGFEATTPCSLYRPKGAVMASVPLEMSRACLNVHAPYKREVVGRLCRRAVSY